MTVQELIDALKKHPLDAEVRINDTRFLTKWKTIGSCRPATSVLNYTDYILVCAAHDGSEAITNHQKTRA